MEPRALAYCANGTRLIGLPNVITLKIHILSKCCIAGNIGREFILVNWRFSHESPNYDLSYVQ